MKGITFNKPFEYTVLVEGEAWYQGDPVKGTLKITNRSSAAEALAPFKIQLASGASDDPLPIAELAFCHDAPLAPQDTHTVDFAFELGVNGPITDSVRKVFLHYGAGRLELIVKPHRTVESFLKVMSVQFKYVTKTIKFNKGRVEVKLKPPDGRAHLFIKQLILKFSYQGQNLNVDYAFEIQKVDASPGSMALKKEIREFSQCFEAADITNPYGRFNSDRVEQKAREILDLVVSKSVF